MNLILCVVAASVLVNLAYSEKSMEEETEEMKRNLEQFKVKLGSMKQKVANNSQLQNNFDTAMDDAAKFIETLNDCLTVFQQQRSDKEKGNTGADNFTKNKLIEKNIPNEKLESVRGKLEEIIIQLGALKNKAKAGDSLPIILNTNYALKEAVDLNEIFNATLKREVKVQDITNLVHLTGALHGYIQQIGSHTVHAKQPKEVQKLQQSALRIVKEVYATLKKN